MAEELENIRQQLTRLGLEKTLASLEVELQTHELSLPINAASAAAEKKLPFVPFALTQSADSKTKSSLEYDAFSNFPVFTIRTGHEFAKTEFLENEVQNIDGDSGTPLSFSGLSFASNTSTVQFSPTAGLSPETSPFSMEDSSQLWPNKQRSFSDDHHSMTEYTIKANQGNVLEVDSINDNAPEKPESVFSLQSRGMVLDLDLNGSEPAQYSTRDVSGPQTTSVKTQQGFNDEIFSFPLTPAGSETGSGTALQKLSSLSTRTLSDFNSSESVEKLSIKIKSTNASSNSPTTSSGLDQTPGSPFSIGPENPLKEDVMDLTTKNKKRCENMKRVSLTLSHNAQQWACMTNECVFASIQEQPQTTTFPFSHDRAFSFPLYPFSQDYIDQTYDLIELKVYHRKGRTGFESSKDLYVDRGDVIAGRYQVLKEVGSAVFSKAIKALDLKHNKEVCLKMVKNVKDYFDQSLDEIKLLKFVNRLDPDDKQGVVRLLDFFYYREHLFLVFELLKQNLYEVQRQSLEFCGTSLSKNYFFNLHRIQIIASQLIRSLVFLHSLNIIHSDLKPENILMKDLESCTVKVIDLGSSCFVSDYLGTYIQSRSYRAPEVVLGVDYDQKVDLWSLGCILAEAFTGHVLFQNSSSAQLMTRIEEVRGPVPEWMIKEGKYSHQYYSISSRLDKQSSIHHSLDSVSSRHYNGSWEKTFSPDDRAFHDFVSRLLTIDPRERPTAQEISNHPWLKHKY
eukprot:g4625.t1